MSILIPKNSFYKKQLMTDVVQLDQHFSDLPVATDTTNKLATVGNVRSAFSVLMTGTVPPKPQYGEATLKGAYLSIQPNSIDIKTNRTSFAMDVYPLQHNTIISGGSFTLAKNNKSGAPNSGSVVGGKVGVYFSTADSEHYYMAENFDGADVDIGSISRQGPNSMLTYNEPFIYLSNYLDYANKKAGTNLPAKYFINASSYNHLHYYPFRFDVAAFERGSKKHEGKRYKGSAAKNPQIKIWFTKDKTQWYTKWEEETDGDGFVGAARYTIAGKNIKHPIEDLQALVQYRHISSSPIDLDATPAATTNNTIFNDLYATRLESNPYDGQVNNPMINSVIELSTANSLNGGQALRFYHNWGDSPLNPKIMTTLHASGNLTPQTSRASLYNIPLPPPSFEIGNNTISATNDDIVYGNHRGTVPEIQIGMNITKLDPTIQLNVSGGRHIAAPFSYAKQYALDGTSSHPAQTTAGQAAYTFLRSVVVTFSNYKPKEEHTTVDKFIDYGMSRFYSGEATENIVGGVMMFRGGIDGQVNEFQLTPNVLYAMPIPTTQIAQAPSGSANTDSTILQQGGLAHITGSTTAGSLLENLDLVSPGYVDLRFSSTTRPQLVEIPMNSWFTMRVFSNASFNNNATSTKLNPYALDGSAPTYKVTDGSCMRVLFDKGTVGTGSSDAQTTDIPFLDIPFPQALTNSPTGDATSENYNWNDMPQYYPQHMTVWVQNFPWVSNAASGATSEIGYEWNSLYGGGVGATRVFLSGDNQILASGASREAEVFVDNVKLIHYEPSIKNTNKTGNIPFQPRSTYSPIALAVSGTKYRKQWVYASGTLLPTTNKGELYNYNVGQQVCVGFDDKGDLPISSDTFGSDSSGYILFNDFSTTNWTTMSTDPFNESLFKSKGFFNRGSDALLNTAGAIISKASITNQNGATQVINLGEQLEASNYMIVGTAAATLWDNVSGANFVVSPSGNIAAGKLSLGAGTNSFYSCDAFRQKGFTHLSVDGSNYSGWTKRENILVSTKITNIPTVVPDATTTSDEKKDSLDNNTIQVRNAEIFNYDNEHETYRIYKMGYPSGTAVMRSGLKLDSLSAPVDGTLTFTEDISLADDGTTTLMTEANLPWLWIGPEKYWVSMLWDSPASLTPRNYSNACTVTETPNSGTAAQLGSTVNEFTYTYDVADIGTGGASALYKRQWELYDSSIFAPMLAGGDYGMNEGSDSAIEGLAASTEVYFDKTAYFNLDNYIKSSPISSSLSSPIPLLLTVGEGTDVEEASIFTDGVTNTYHKPTLYVRYEDKPPVISNFKISPNFDLTNTDLYNLTTENLNSIKLNWSESNADDIWYRMLIVDNSNIKDKYHNAKLWLPLNESGSTLDTKPEYRVYMPNLGTSYLLTSEVEASVRAVVEGQGGYAARLDSAATTGKISVPRAQNPAITDLTAFTLSLHYTPSVADLGATSYLCWQSTTLGTAANNFEMYKDNSNRIQVKLGANVTLTSTSIIECDDDVPTSIIVTYDESTSSPIKAKLYIDGTLEDSSTGVSKQTSAADFTIGGDTGTYRGTTGMIEEIVINTQAYEIIDSSGQYIYSTADTVDIVNDANINHNARLIVCDYHNFRGGNPEDIGMSQQASWRTTT